MGKFLMFLGFLLILASAITFTIIWFDFYGWIIILQSLGLVLLSFLGGIVVFMGEHWGEINKTYKKAALDSAENRYKKLLARREEE
jgi:hypothetical protein